MLFLIYIISAVLLFAVLAWEWHNGRKIDYPFGTREYLAAFALIVSPVANTFFLCYILVDYALDAYRHLFNK